ncbi:hypothetical protein ACQP1V_40725 [Microtetraspora malaysiensis]|uniref:hypothetical protein n=1 Tax=Microtetraspora malaysiensis TaxID=161358 RepID=UPI003D91E814
MPDLVRDALGLVTGQVGRPVTHPTVEGGLHHPVARDTVPIARPPRPRPAAARLRPRRRDHPRIPTKTYMRDVRDLGDGRTPPTG